MNYKNHYNKVFFNYYFCIQFASVQQEFKYIVLHMKFVISLIFKILQRHYVVVNKKKELSNKIKLL